MISQSSGRSGRTGDTGRPRGGLVSRTLNRVSRYTEILGVFLRYGFVDTVRKVDASMYRRFKPGRTRLRRTRLSWSRAESFRRALEDLGPTFVKIGQLLSHRPDILPSNWIREFEKLRSRVSPADLDRIRPIFIEECGIPPEELFESFSSEPVASASVAQVYRGRVSTARLGEGGESVEVAIKVQRPGIHRVIDQDLLILRDLARVIERRVPALAVIRPTEVVRELERALRSELDFRNEAKNLDAFNRAFAEDNTVTAPEPLHDLSSRRILVMTWLDGAPVGDSAALDREGADRKVLARRGANAVLRQIFDHRFFHSDPHGDNILILPGNRIGFLDFGQMGRVLPSQKRFLADLMGALIRQDAPRAVRVILGWSGYRDPDDVRRFTTDMEHLMEHFLSRPFGDRDVGDLTSALFDLIRRYDIAVPSNFFLLGKALTTIEDIAQSLDPDFDFIGASESFAKRLIQSEFSADRLKDHAVGLAGDAARLFRDLPGETADLLNLLKAGRLRMEFELKDLERINTTLRRVVTRLASAILLAAMIMGSSILVQSRIPPLIFGMPAIGVLGFLASGIVGVFLLADLWRRR